MTKKPSVRDADTKQLLRTMGLRVTPQRKRILRELAKVKAPVSHAELSERLEGASLDRVTIWRNLLALTDAGVLLRTQLGDNVWRFELLDTTSPQHGLHPHFVCNICGNVACLPANSVSLLGDAARNEVAEVQLRGRCVACARN